MTTPPDPLEPFDSRHPHATLLNALADAATVYGARLPLYARGANAIADAYALIRAQPSREDRAPDVAGIRARQEVAESLTIGLSLASERGQHRAMTRKELNAQLIALYEFAALLDAYEAQGREIEAFKAAVARAHASFKRRHPTTDKCECLYCTQDFEDIAEYAAHMELDLFGAKQKAEKFKAERDALTQALGERNQTLAGWQAEVRRLTQALGEAREHIDDRARLFHHKDHGGSGTFEACSDKRCRQSRAMLAQPHAQDAATETEAEK